MLTFFLIIYNSVIKAFINNGNIIFSYLSLISSFKPAISLNQIDLEKFPPIKVYCYNLSNRWHPDDPSIRKYMYYPDSEEFKYYIEVEVHKELLLSPLLTKNPEEADFFYIPVYPFAVHYKGNMNIEQLISEIRSIGPWFDRKNGADHILTSGWDFAWFGKHFTDEFLKTKIIFCGLYPVIGQSWKDYEYKRFITVPHISYFPKYPFDQVDWTRKRKNKVFVAQTYQTAGTFRMEISEIIKKIPNNDIYIFTRAPNDIITSVQKLPPHYMDSDFCICPKGDNPIAKRNFDGPHYGCIPVYISDDLVLPFAGNLLNYTKFSIRIPEKDIMRIPEILESYTQDEILEMRNELKKCAKMYLFRLGEAPRIGEGFWAISWMWYIRYQYNLQFDFKYYPPSFGKHVNERNYSSNSTQQSASYLK